MSKFQPSRRKFLATGGSLAAVGALSASPSTAGAVALAHWDEEVDVLVAGTGAAGSSAALFAHEAGAHVLMVEKGPAHGGTTQKSGGQFWIPNNRFLRAEGIGDPRGDFLRYVARYSYPATYDPRKEALGVPEGPYALMGTFYDNASVAVEELERLGAFSCVAVRMSSKDKDGPYNYFSWDQDKRPSGRVLAAARSDGSAGAGDELIGRLRTAVAARKIEVRVRHAVTEVVRNPAGEVIGAVVLADGKRTRIRARKGVIFATGGYTHNLEMRTAFQSNPILGGCAVASSTGDFISIGTAVGARLGNLSGAWRGQFLLEDILNDAAAPQGAWVTADSSFIVNRYGRRCVNELRNYHDRARSQYAWDPILAGYPNLLNILVYDRRCATLYGGVSPYPPSSDAADNVLKADTLAELGVAIDRRLGELAKHTGGIRLSDDFAQNLAGTVSRFNAMAANGVDEDFHRGETGYEQNEAFSIADMASRNPAASQWAANSGKNICIYPLQEKGPYYAILLVPGVLDTNGGPEIDTKARVLDQARRPIRGLFGAGNCVASPVANSYWAAGATIGLAMTFGMIAGKSAAAEPVHLEHGT